MTNPYYNPTGTPATRSAGSSSAVRSEFTAIGQGFDDVDALLDAHAAVVTTRTAMKALDTTLADLCWLAEGYRRGPFLWTAGDYTARVAADTLEGFYVKADAVAASSGCWVRQDRDLRPEYFGADPTGQMDSTAAWLAAGTYSGANRNKTITGDSSAVYRINGTVLMARGVAIVGEGSAGSSESSGLVFKHYGTGNCIEWDGSGTDYQGTGGGLRHALIVKAGMFTGGDALKIKTTSDAKRAGEMLCENLLSYGVNPAVWTAGRYVYTGDHHFGGFVNNCYRLYIATSTGTTGATIPTGTGSGINDGGVTWNYVKVMTAVTHTPGATYATGDIVLTSANRFYIAMGPGIAGVTTPTGTGTGISDGAVTWDYHSAYTISQGLWARGLHVDGTATNTAGARGVRTLQVKRCRFAEVTTANEAILLNQVTHFYAEGIATDVGNGSGAGVTIKGINDGVNIIGFEFGGAITIIANDASNTTNNLNLVGSLASTFTNNDTQCNGVADLVFSDSALLALTNKSKSLKITSNINPSFMLRRSSVHPNPVTGDGTQLQVQWETEEFDKGNNISGGTPTTFTCLCAGSYTFEAGVYLSGLTAPNTDAYLIIAQAGSATRSLIHQVNPYAIAVAGFASLTLSGTLELAYGDTVIVKTRVAGTAANSVGVYGTGGTIYSWFSGKYHGS